MKYYELTLSDDYKQYVTESELEEMIEDCMRFDGIIPFSRRQISKEEFRIGRLEQRVEDLEEKIEQVSQQANTYTPAVRYRTTGQMTKDNLSQVHVNAVVMQHKEIKQLAVDAIDFLRCLEEEGQFRFWEEGYNTQVLQELREKAKELGVA